MRSTTTPSFKTAWAATWMIPPTTTMPTWRRGSAPLAIPRIVARSATWAITTAPTATPTGKPLRLELRRLPQHAQLDARPVYPHQHPQLRPLPHRATRPLSGQLHRLPQRAQLGDIDYEHNFSLECAACHTSPAGRPRRLQHLPHPGELDRRNLRPPGLYRLPGLPRRGWPLTITKVSATTATM